MKCTVCNTKEVDRGQVCSTCRSKASRAKAQLEKDKKARHAELATEDTPGAVLRQMVGDNKDQWVVPGAHYLGEDPEKPWVWSTCLNPECTSTNMAERGTHEEESPEKQELILTDADVIWYGNNAKMGADWPNWGKLVTRTCTACKNPHQFKTHLESLHDCGVS